MPLNLPRLYGELAEWFHLLTAPEEYAEEAAFYAGLIQAHCSPPPRRLLELGSGGGNNASHLKAHFEMTLSDISMEMLAISRSINPDCEHILGDMRAMRLNRTFDAVFAHDALDYLTTLDDLRRAVQTARVHCRPGGVVLLAPDTLRETFRPATSHGGRDGLRRALRYLEWTWDPDPSDTAYRTEMAYLLRQEDGSVRVEMDRHELGLFSRGQWLEVMGGCGLSASVIPFEHSEVEPGTLEVFVGKVPSGAAED